MSLGMVRFSSDSKVYCSSCGYMNVYDQEGNVLKPQPKLVKLQDGAKKCSHVFHTTCLTNPNTPKNGCFECKQQAKREQGEAEREAALELEMAKTSAAEESQYEAVELQDLNVYKR